MDIITIHRKMMKKSEVIIEEIITKSTLQSNSNDNCMYREPTDKQKDIMRCNLNIEKES